jgi:hypothetical protein
VNAAGSSSIWPPCPMSCSKRPENAPLQPTRSTPAGPSMTGAPSAWRPPRSLNSHTDRDLGSRRKSSTLALPAKKPQPGCRELSRSD